MVDAVVLIYQLFLGITLIFAFCSNLLSIVSFGFTFKSVAEVFDCFIIVTVFLRGYFITFKIFQNIFNNLSRGAIVFLKSLKDVGCWFLLAFFFIRRATTVTITDVWLDDCKMVVPGTVRTDCSCSKVYFWSVLSSKKKQLEPLQICLLVSRWWMYWTMFYTKKSRNTLKAFWVQKGCFYRIGFWWRDHRGGSK